MNKKIIALVGIVLFAVVIYFISENYFKKEPLKSDKFNASIRFGWIPSASFSGEIVGMERFAEKNNLDLKCEPGGPGLNSIQLVQTDQNTFGTLAADEVLAANDKGADFVIIGVINYYSPGGFISLFDKNINTPKDLEGKTIGMLPFGSTNMLMESLIRKNNLDKNKIKEITVSPDLKPFLEGKYDVHPVFVYDETVTLDQRNIKYNLLEPKNYGVTFKGPVYFCKRVTLDKYPDLVKAFVNTMAEGWNYAIQNPDSAVMMLKKFAPEIDSEREILVLQKGIPYFSAYKNQPINSDFDSWSTMVNELKELKVIKNDIDLNKVVKLNFINDYYSNKNN